MASQSVHDPRVLRAVAHPVRTRILSELSASGPSRAADLARDLDIPANQASFHLRQLAKYGLVVEAPEEARDRRDRVWKVASDQGFRLDVRAMEEAPGGRAAVDVWRRSAEGWAHHLVHEAYALRHEEGVHVSITDTALRLTQEEGRSLTTELNEVVDRWASRTRGRDDGRTTYTLLAILQPLPAPLTGPDEQDEDA